MSVLVVGLNHKGAPLATLEQVALAGDALDKLLHDVSRADDVAGALVLSTCNRVEIYAEVGKFHGAVAAICELLSRHSHVPQAELTPYLYVHYEDRALQHLLTVACGLDSMVVGESQILGQLRQALRTAREQGTLGRTLSALGTMALRAGKRAQSETAVGQAGANLVTVGLEAAAQHLSPAGTGPLSLAGQDVLVIGAGAMSGLAVAKVVRAGADSLVVASRTRARAERLAASAGGRAADMASLPALIAAADLVVTCTGAAGHVITADITRSALTARAELRTGPPPASRRSWCLTWQCRGTSSRRSRPCPAWPSLTWKRSPPTRRLVSAPMTGMSARSAGSWPRNLPPIYRPAAPPLSRRLLSRCAPRPPGWWRLSWPGWRAGSTGWTPRR